MITNARTIRLVRVSRSLPVNECRPGLIPEAEMAQKEVWPVDSRIKVSSCLQA